jgi:lipoate-protein ligase A
MTFHLVHTQNISILEQLRLEEALLRADQRNWCLINEGSTPAIVMGISGKKEELVDLNAAAEHQIPLIKRFSGGGTVIVDKDTLFITFICDKTMHPFPAYPEPILKWTAEIYRAAFQDLPFDLRENDYVIGEKKCGGNAQYIKKDRWLHHTSFLWDYAPHHMQLLLHPKKTPTYRQNRVHDDFLCRLCTYLPSKKALLDQFKTALGTRYVLKEIDINEALELCQAPHRQTTHLISD